MINTSLPKIENLYTMLQQKEWLKLMELEKQNRKSFSEDDQLRVFIEKYFLVSLIDYIKKESDENLVLIISKKVYFHFLHTREVYYNFGHKQFVTLMEIYVKALEKQKSISAALSITKTWKEEVFAKEFIKKYKHTQNEKISHKNSDFISVTKNNTDKKIGKTIDLFRSTQEYDFYQAIIEYFPGYIVYPNVAVSCLIDFDSVKDGLSPKEQTYFFNAIVDNVVFKRGDKNFTPKYFFELDSVFHDSKKAKESDLMKNKIFTLAGQELIRIRSTHDIKISREKFVDLIKEKIYE